MRNILKFKDKESLIRYLDNLKEEELILEFNVCDNLYEKINYIALNIEEEIDVNFRIKIIDDQYNQLINNDREYIINKLQELKKYLDKIDKELIEIVEYYDTTKLMVNSLSYLINYENKSYKESILIIYDKLINEYHDGLYDRLKRMSYRMNKYIEMKIDSISNNLFLDEYFMGYYQNNVDEMIKMLTKTLEYELGTIIDFNNFFETKLSKEHYQILKQTNCINKLGLINRPSLIGCDLHDVVMMFHDRQILIIENGDEKHNFIDNDDIQFEGVINISFYSNFDNFNLSEYEKKYRGFIEKYKEIDPLFVCYKGDLKEITIYLK